MIDSYHMNDTDCIFCKIIRGELPAERVYEDENTLAFLEILPINPGHTLVIPKDHYTDLIDAPENVVMDMMRTVKKISHAFRAALNVDDFNLAMNNGITAGQVVFHAHIHVMPRHAGDNYELWKGKEYPDGEAKKIREKIKNSL